MNPSEASLVIGNKLTLKTTLTPGSARANLTWESSKTSVATVSSSGVVTAVGEGSAKITVKTQNGKKASCKVEVTDPYKPTGIHLNMDSVTISAGQTVQLKATLSPSGAKTTLTWESGKTKVATVNSSGLVTGISRGEAKITVKTANGKKDSVKVKVEGDPTPVSGRVDLIQYLGQNGSTVQKALGLKSDYDEDQGYPYYYGKDISGASCYTNPSIVDYITLEADTLKKYSVGGAWCDMKRADAEAQLKNGGWKRAGTEDYGEDLLELIYQKGKYTISMLISNGRVDWIQGHLDGIAPAASAYTWKFRHEGEMPAYLYLDLYKSGKKVDSVSLGHAGSNCIDAVLYQLQGDSVYLEMVESWHDEVTVRYRVYGVSGGSISKKKGVVAPDCHLAGKLVDESGSRTIYSGGSSGSSAMIGALNEAMQAYGVTYKAVSNKYWDKSISTCTQKNLSKKIASVSI